MRRRDLMSFVGTAAGLAARRTRAATRRLRPQRGAQNSLRGFKQILFSSCRNRRRLRGVEGWYPILANKGIT
jgi:hypothetical protein